MINKIIIANCVSVIESILSFIKHGTINRHKQIKLNIITHSINCITYFMLGAFSGLGSNIWALLKSIYLIVVHKEEKVKLNNIEVVLLNIPYLIVAFLGFKTEGWVAIIYGLVAFLDGSVYWWKSDYSRVISSVFIQFYYAIYNVLALDFVKVAKHLVNTFINIINIFRIKKNGEGKYYKKNDEHRGM